MAVQIFNNGDNKYLSWMIANPECYVVNTRRTPNSHYFYLHKSLCHHITTTTGLSNGAYTLRDFIKVVSEDVNELRDWFLENNNNFKGKFQECKTCRPFSGKSFDHIVSLFPDTVEDEELLIEGAKKQIIVNAYERNLNAREKCINHFGYSCSVCDINFENTYGLIGKDFIHVHHLKELHSIGKEYSINPIKDLRPVCPNCHAMLHQKKPCYSIEELKARLKNRS